MWRDRAVWAVTVEDETVRFNTWLYKTRLIQKNFLFFRFGSLIGREYRGTEWGFSTKSKGCQRQKEGNDLTGVYCKKSGNLLSGKH